MNYFRFILDRIAEFTSIEWLGLALAALCLVLIVVCVLHMLRLCRDGGGRDGGIT